MADDEEVDWQGDRIEVTVRVMPSEVASPPSHPYGQGMIFLLLTVGIGQKSLRSVPEGCVGPLNLSKQSRSWEALSPMAINCSHS